MARYYTFTLSHDEKAALAEGQKNDNLKSWTAKDLILHEEALKDIKPTNLSIGPNEQLYHKLHKSRVNSAPAVQQTANGPVAQERAKVFAASRTTSDGGYFAPKHRPVSYRPPHPPSSGVRVRSPLANEVSYYQPRKHVTFDGILVPHGSGKGETYPNGQDAHVKKAKKTTGI
ncbi:hypothetical protein E8E11_006178 [Didymella keratinophila]|nr:hypothetical protein E8E11_006178 [Didymella keratinophila]